MTLEKTRPVRRRSYGGASLEDRQAKRRATFIAAGHTLFGTIGYQKTTVRSLCREAELTDRYFYESFMSIEALLVVVYSGLINDLQANILSAIQSLDNGESLDEVIHAGLEAFFSVAEDPQVARILYIEILSVGEGAEAFYNVTLRQFAALFLMLTKSQIPKMNVTNEIGAVLAMGVIGAISETAKSWLLGGYAHPKAVLIEGMAIMIRGLAQQIATAP
ncbi:MAG: TetR/AcrR family transcriptional regulator [Paraperlucidibaca sp.]